MNVRGVVLAAILLVLGVALWASIYYGTGAGLSGSSGPQNSPYNEFTATVSVEEDPISYTATAYSKLVWSSSGTLQGWVLEGHVDYAQEGRNFRHIYNNGYVIFGEIMADSSFNISGCERFNQDRILNTGYNSFVPEPLADAKDTLLTTQCPACNAWRLTLSEHTFYMLEQSGDPKFLQSWDKVITVTSFVRNQRTYTAPINPLTLPQCIPEPPADGTPANENDTVVAPQSMEEGHMHLQEQLMKEQEQLAREEMEALQRTNQPRPPVQFHTHVVDASAVKGPLGKVQQLLHAMRAKSQNLSIDATADFQTQGYCPSTWRGDGYCDDGCNSAENNYDDGDCCAGCCKTGRRYSCGCNGYRCARGCNSGPSKPCLFLHGLGQTGDGSFRSSKPPGYPYFGHPSYWGNMESILSGICTSFIYSYANTNGYSWADPALFTPYYNKAKEVIAAGGVVFAHSMGNPILGGACLINGWCDVNWYMIGGPLRGAKSASTEGALLKIFGMHSNTGTRSLTNEANYMKNGWNKDALSRTVNDRRLLKGALCGNRPWGGGGLSGVAMYAVGALVYQGWECTGSFWGICYDWTLKGSDGLVGVDECQQYGYWANNKWNSYYTQGNVWGSNSNSPFMMSAANHYDETGNMGDIDGCVSWIKNMARRG